MNRLKPILILIVLSCLLVSSSQAAIYYVDQSHPQANDTNPGNENLTCLMVQYTVRVIFFIDLLRHTSLSKTMDGRFDASGTRKKNTILMTGLGALVYPEAQ